MINNSKNKIIQIQIGLELALNHRGYIRYFKDGGVFLYADMINKISTGMYKGKVEKTITKHYKDYIPNNWRFFIGIKYSNKVMFKSEMNRTDYIELNISLDTALTEDCKKFFNDNMVSKFANIIALKKTTNQEQINKLLGNYINKIDMKKSGFSIEFVTYKPSETILI